MGCMFWKSEFLISIALLIAIACKSCVELFNDIMKNVLHPCFKINCFFELINVGKYQMECTLSKYAV